jgi:DNA-damage-inducible protein J
MPSSIVTIRMDSEIKKQAQAIFNDLGMDMTTAMNIFVRQVIREQAIPFRVQKNREQNRETLMALLEAERLVSDPAAKRYTVEEALEELKR